MRFVFHRIRELCVGRGVFWFALLYGALAGGATHSLVHYGLSLKVGPCFQHGMSLKD